MGDIELVLESEGGMPEDAEGFVSDILDDPDEVKEVMGRLRGEYYEAKSVREDKERTWAKWRRQAEARPQNERKDYPYPNASNVSPPLSLIVGQALYAHLKGMYDNIDPPWYVESLRKDDPEYVKDAELLTRYYNLISKSRLDLNLGKFKRTFLQEIAIMGTCFVKVPWTRKEWRFKSEAGGLEEEVNAALHDGPELVVIPIEDLVYPENWADIQKMPWVAHDMVMAGYELEDMASSGVYDREAVDQMLEYSRSGVSTAGLEERDAIMQSKPDRKDEFVVTEIYFYYDSDKDGRHEDLVFTVHMDSGVVLRQGYNEFGYRMMSAGVFVERTFAIEGRGSGQTTEYQQDEVEGIHNVRNDNMKFSNMRVLSARRGAIRENETIYPGKIFITDNPREDIVPLQLGEIYPSSLQAEHQTMQYAREASGMSSIMGGFADPTLGSRDTFRGQSMRMNQGQGLFSTIAEGLNECFSEIGMMIFFQLVKHRNRVVESERRAMRLSEDEIERLDRILALRLEEVPLRLAFSIRTSDVDQTFEVKRQNLLSLTQLFSQFAMQTTPLAMQLFGPEGQQMQQMAPDAYAHMLSIYTGSTKLMQEVFRFFGEDDPGKYVPDIRKYELLQDMLREMTTEMINGAKAERQEGPGQGQGQGPVGIEEEMAMRAQANEVEREEAEGQVMAMAQQAQQGQQGQEQGGQV